MRERFTQRIELLVDGPAVPIGVLPLGVARDVDKAGVPFGDQLVQLFQAVGMEALQEIHPFRNARERRSVTRQYKVNIQIAHLVQAGKELLQRIVAGDPAHDGGRDALQHVVAGDKQLQRWLVQADMPVVVAGRGDYLEAVVAVAVHVAVAQVEQVGLVLRGHQLGRNLVGAGIALLHAALIVGVRAHQMADKRVVHGGLDVHEVAHFLEGMHIGVHAHPAAPDAVQVARVVGVRMGKHDLHRFPIAAQLVQRGIERLLAFGLVQAHIDDGGFVFAEDEVRVQVLKRVSGQGNGHAPDARVNLFDFSVVVLIGIAAHSAPLANQPCRYPQPSA